MDRGEALIAAKKLAAKSERGIAYAQVWGDGHWTVRADPPLMRLSTAGSVILVDVEGREELA